jgi:hypothetical protein
MATTRVLDRCLDVGIRICGDLQDYMVDDITGITSDMAQALQGDEMQAFGEFFKDLKDSAYKQFLKDAELKFSGEKAFNHIVAQSPPYGARKLSVPILSKDIVGYKIKIPYHQFTQYNLKSLDLYAIQKSSIQVYVIDLLNGDTLYSETKEVLKGRQNIKIGEITKSYDSTLLFVGVRIISGSLMAVSCSDSGDCCGCECLDECDISLGTLKEDGIHNCEAILDYDYKAFCPNDAIECNFQDMICEYASFFNDAFNSKVAVNLLEEKLNTYQRSWFADANVQITIDYTLPQTKEMYYKLLSLAISNIRGIMKDGVCFSCDGNLSKTYLMSSYA